MKLLLFDFDGVIADSLAFYEHSVNLCLERLGVPRLKSRAGFLALFDDNFYEGITRLGVDGKDFTYATAMVSPQLDFSRIGIHREVLEVVETLRAEHILSLISSNSAQAIRTIHRGIDSYFDYVLGYEFMFSKIDKIRHEMKRTGIPKERTYYIGDTLGDMKEAKIAEVQTIAVTWGWHSRERLSTVNPDFIIETPRELERIVNSK